MNKTESLGLKSIASIPTIEEMNGRILKVQKLMIDQQLDYYVCVSPDNILYLTNFANFIHERPFILIVPSSGKVKFLIPKLETLHVRTRMIGDIELVDYHEFPAPAGMTWDDGFKSFFSPQDKVGIESSCPVFVRDVIAGNVIITEIVEEVRMIKSDYEIGRILYASEMVSDAMGRVLSMAKPGMSMLAVHSGINRSMMLKLLLDIPEINFLATRISIAVQPPGISHDPHNFTNIMDMDMVKGGPHVAILNCVINGYSSEVERTFFIGDVPEEAIKPYNVMMEARRKAFELCVPGQKMSEVDRQVNKIFKNAGYGENLLHRTGHSIGVTGHEGPFLAEGYDKIIQPGMFFTIEPGIYLPGIGGFRHSDTILTTENGNISFTTVPDAIDEMTFKTPIISFSSHIARHRIALMRLYARWKGIELLR